MWLESGFAENSTLHSSIRCLRLVVESSTLFLITVGPMIVAPLELVNATLSQLVIHQGQQNKMNSNTIEAFWTINNNNENMLNLILMSHK